MLLGLCAGTKEHIASAREFLRDLKVSKLHEPVLVASDGAPGLMRALEEVFPKSLRQRCLAHRIRPLGRNVPAECWREVKAQATPTYMRPNEPDLGSGRAPACDPRWRTTAFSECGSLYATPRFVFIRVRGNAGPE